MRLYEINRNRIKEKEHANLCKKIKHNPIQDSLLKRPNLNIECCLDKEKATISEPIAFYFQRGWRAEDALSLYLLAEKIEENNRNTESKICCIIGFQIMKTPTEEKKKKKDFNMDNQCNLIN